MFAERFFAAMAVWRVTPTPSPRTSSWLRAPDGVERRFTLFRATPPAASARRRLTPTVRIKRTEVATVPLRRAG